MNNMENEKESISFDDAWLKGGNKKRYWICPVTKGNHEWRTRHEVLHYQNCIFCGLSENEYERLKKDEPK